MTEDAGRGKDQSVSIVCSDAWTGVKFTELLLFGSFIPPRHTLSNTGSDSSLRGRWTDLYRKKPHIFPDRGSDCPSDTFFIRAAIRAAARALQLHQLPSLLLLHVSVLPLIRALRHSQVGLGSLSGVWSHGRSLERRLIRRRPTGFHDGARTRQGGDGDSKTRNRSFPPNFPFSRFSFSFTARHSRSSPG